MSVRTVRLAGSERYTDVEVVLVLEEEIDKVWPGCSFPREEWQRQDILRVSAIGPDGRRVSRLTWSTAGESAIQDEEFLKILRDTSLRIFDNLYGIGRQSQLFEP